MISARADIEDGADRSPGKADPLDFYALSLDCVHCGLCLEVCPTYRVLGLEPDSPRGRIYLMRALAEQRVADHEVVRQHLDQCLGCRACETACPSGVRYGEMLESVRAQMTTSSPARGFRARARRFLLGQVVARQGRLRLAFRLGRAAELLGLRALAFRLGVLPALIDRLVPRIPPAAERRSLRGTYRPDGAPRGRVHLFTGCVMEQVFGRINRLTIDLLVQNGFEVVVPGEQGCCGALLLHDGQRERAARAARANLRAFADAEVIVNNSAGCGAAMKDYDHLLSDEAGASFATRSRDVLELLAERGLAAAPAPFPHRVAYDAPCHLSHGQGVRTAPAALLRQVPGLELVPNESAEDCCGSAGIYNLLQPALAAEIGARKAAALTATGARFVATGNPGCMMQIQAHLDAAGSTVRVVHPVELLLPRGTAVPP